MATTEFEISLKYNGGSTTMSYTETHRTLNACLNSVKGFLRSVMYQQVGNTASVCITFDGKEHNYFFSLRGHRLFLELSYISRVVDID